ncbi:MAG: 3-oxoadipyl-CoA thiolase [Bacteroidota bacterium]|nr:3-oxoadipyl-CoA thiolase [Bacteroidota bacterium]
MKQETYIIDGIRSPIGSFGGVLSGVRADDLAAEVLKKLLERNSSIDPSQIDDIILGCANQAGEDNRNVARMASLLAGIPYTVPAETVNRLCASGMSAVIHSHRALQTGDGHLFIAGGVENMTRGPWVISKTSTAFGRDAKMYDSSFGWRFKNPALEKEYGCETMGETAENLAEQYKINRKDQDQFAFWSQQKTKIAIDKNKFSNEIMGIEVVIGKNEIRSVVQDEFPKPGSTLDKLAQLKPAFRSGGTVTAGNSSGLNDGAAALLIASSQATKDYNLIPKARIVSSAVVGVEPRIMGIGPVAACKKALQKAGLTLDQIEYIEINEAFAAQVLACTRELGLQDDDPRINPNGGAIALGHPLGMTGARLIQTASLELSGSTKKYALCAMCIGVGQGYAVILERV